jgi:hypothetical protein
VDSIWTIVIIVVISIVSSWLKKKGGLTDEVEDWTRRDTPPEPPRRPASPIDPFGASGTIPRQQSSSAPPPLPPPQMAGWEDRLRKTLAGQGIPVPMPPKSAQAPSPFIQPAKLVIPTQMVIRTRVEEREGPGGKPLANFTQAETRYFHASQLQEQVARHMQGIDAATRRHKAAAAIVPERRPLIRLLKTRASMKEAIIASVLLGPPRALESSRSL